MAWAGVQRSITLTNLAPADHPEPWQHCRRTYRRVREYLVREGIDPGLWGVFIERGDDTGMIHAHVAQRGPSKLPKDALQAAAHRAGAGWSRIEAIRAGDGFSRYVGKGFSAYVGKGFTSTTASEALRLNGGRLGHFSRGFFQSEDGGTLGVRDAERRAHEALRTPESGQWLLMREGSVPTVPAPA